MWGGFRPYGAKSMRANDMPKVLRPSILSTLRRVTFDPSGFEVSLGVSSPEKKKSLAVASLGSLQNFPLTNTAVGEKKQLLYIAGHKGLPNDEWLKYIYIYIY
jgi:hypothetical protein